MAEDYTWDETVTAHGYAVQNAELKRANDSLAAQERDLEAQLNAAILGQQQLERENVALTREVAGLRYYIWQLERNVTQEERAYAAGVARLQLSAQIADDDTDAPLKLATVEDGDE